MDPDRRLVGLEVLPRLSHFAPFLMVRISWPSPKHPGCAGTRTELRVVRRQITSRSLHRSLSGGRSAGEMNNPMDSFSRGKMTLIYAQHQKTYGSKRKTADTDDPSVMVISERL